MRACFPSTTIETIDYWEDLAKLDRTFVFDRVIIVSREASGRQYVLLFSSAFQFLDGPAAVHYQANGSK
jgi:hypothetical protein